MRHSLKLWISKPKEFVLKRRDTNSSSMANINKAMSMAMAGVAEPILPAAGSLTSFQRRLGGLQVSEELTYPIPNYIIHTLSGSIPHLTPDVFQMSFNQYVPPPPLQISIESTYTFHENIGPSGQNISQFVGLPTFPSFLTVHNPLLTPIPGYNDKLGISIWPRTGRVTLNCGKFLEIISDFQPNYVQCLSDFDIDKLSSSNRVRKSTKRTLKFLQEILDKNIKNVKLFATIEIGWFLADKEEACRTVAAILENRDRLFGFFISGVKNLNAKDSEMSIISEILALLPNTNDASRIVPGPFEPYEIIDLVLRGVDLFDSSSVTKMTEEGKAFKFSLNDILGETTRGKAVAKIIQENLPLTTKDLSEKDNNNLSLKDKRFFNDGGPILDECDCYTCRKHTRSYLHHLLTTGELLGFVLLMSHNLFHFDRFFKAIRLCLNDAHKMSILQEIVQPSTPPNK